MPRSSTNDDKPADAKATDPAAEPAATIDPDTLVVDDPAAVDPEPDPIVDQRALTLSKQLQAAYDTHGDDVVEAALRHAANARKAAGTNRGDVPDGRADAGKTTR